MPFKTSICLLLICACFSCTNKKAHLLKPADQVPAGSAVYNCDTTQVSYSKTVELILKNNCYSCHASSVTVNTNTIDLENFASLKNYLKNTYRGDTIYGSKFIHIIKQSFGVLPMPPLGKLSPCDIGAINNWVQAGALNN